MKTNPAVSTLIQALGSHDPILIENATISLQKHRDIVLPFLVEALTDEHNHLGMRMEVAKVLGALGDGRAVEHLFGFLKDESIHIRNKYNVAEALKKLGWQPPDDEHMGLYLVAIRDFEECANLGLPAVDPIIKCIQGIKSTSWDNPYIMYDTWSWIYKAIRALGQIWQLPDLVLLGSDDQKQQWRAARALGKLGDLRAVKPLIATLYNNQDYKVQIEVVKALGELGDGQAVVASSELLVISTWTNAKLRSTVFEVLYKLKPPIEPFVEYLSNTRGVVRAMAASILGALKDTQAVEPLIAALEDDELRVRWVVAEALGNLGDRKAVAPLIRAFKESFEKRTDNKPRDTGASKELGGSRFDFTGSYHIDVQYEVVVSLGKLGDVRALDILVTALGDKDIRVAMAAAEALGNLGDRRAVSPLIDALRNIPGRVKHLVYDTFKDRSERLELQRKIIDTLGNLDDLSAGEHLVSLLKEPSVLDSNKLRYSTIQALGKLWKIPALVELGKSRSSQRQRASQLLGDLGDIRVIEPLTATALKDTSSDVRQAADEAFRKLDLQIRVRDSEAKKTINWPNTSLHPTRAPRGIGLRLHELLVGLMAKLFRHSRAGG